MDLKLKKLLEMKDELKRLSEDEEYLHTTVTIKKVKSPGERVRESLLKAGFTQDDFGR